jgi:hypothetical protein
MGPAIIAFVSSIVLLIAGTNQIVDPVFPGAMRYGILSLIVLFIAGGLIFNHVRKLPNTHLEQ